MQSWLEQGVGGRHARRQGACARLQKRALLDLLSPQDPRRQSSSPIRWCVSCCWIRWPMCCARRPSCGTPATARNMMREAVSLMGGYGITEDCPGFLGNKWMDAQLEATYEGPEAVQRRQLSVTMTNRGLPGAVPRLDRGDARRSPRRIPAPERARWPRRCACGCGRSSICSTPPMPTDDKLYQSARQGVTFPLADALCWLLAARARFSMCSSSSSAVPTIHALRRDWPGMVNFMTDLCHVQAARAAAKCRASARSWSLATTGIPRGTRQDCGCFSSGRIGCAGETHAGHRRDGAGRDRRVMDHIR